MRPGWRGALLALCGVMTLSGCSFPGDTAPHDVDADAARDALTQYRIALPGNATFRGGRVSPRAFVGRASYDLAYEAPAQVFTDLTAADINWTYGPFVDIDCAHLRGARLQGWVTCAPQTRAKATSDDPNQTVCQIYCNTVALVEGRGKTYVIVVIGGS